jgi:hypothetical protein
MLGNLELQLKASFIVVEQNTENLTSSSTPNRPSLAL